MKDAGDDAYTKNVKALVALLSAGPQPFGLPTVSAALAITGGDVGGPLHFALEDLRLAGVVRILNWREVSERGLPNTGWPWCEDVR